ncbi:hypothetical protein CC2G_010033 [Coprinopsis cinerea AmutBmut pab1-1]|nr:hypothetical protein CC2G_010033 [Coprinopsis cinerea AmutBmut pab1-1]
MSLDPQASRDLLDKKIGHLRIQKALLQEQIRQLCEDRNGLSPVSRVPDEILCEIFMLCAQIWTERPNGPKPWIAVTHVSRRWRTVALNYPNFWSTIYDPDRMGPSWLSTWLKRSQETPLTIEIPDLYYTDRPRLPEVQAELCRALSQTWRLREVDIAGRGDQIDVFLASMASPAPLLKKLRIVNGSTHVIVFPETFLNGDASNVQELIMFNCSLPRDPSVFMNVTELNLYYHTNAGPGASIRESLPALGKLPSLSALTLELPPTTFDSAMLVPLPQTIELASIAFLDVTATESACTALLQSIRIPCQGVDLRTHITDTMNESSFAAYASAFSSVWLPPIAGSGRALLLNPPIVILQQGDYGDALFVKAHTEEDYFSLWLEDPDPIPTLSTLFPDADTHSLVLRGKFPVEINPFFDSFPKAEELDLRGQTDAISLLTYLEGDQALSARRTNQQQCHLTRLPCLTRIVVRNVDLGGEYANGVCIFDELLDVLEARARIVAQAGIQRIDFDWHCQSLDEPWMGRLREIVENVTVGEVEDCLYVDDESDDDDED